MDPSHHLTARDDVCRDLKKQLLEHADPDPHASRSRSSSEPAPCREGLLTASAVAQPGGFRRQFLAVQGSLASGHPSLLQKTLPLFRELLDPSLSLPQLFAEDSFTALPPLKKVGEGASNKVTVLVLVKTFLTGTLLVIPNGFRSAGILGGVVVLLLVGFLEVYCMLILVACRERKGAGSYADLARALGTRGPAVITFMLVASQFGFVCAEQVYVAKNLLVCLQPFWPWLRQWHLLLLCQLVLVPMSWVRKLEFFAVTNLVGDAFILVCVLCLLAFGAGRAGSRGPAPGLEPWGDAGGIALFFGTCVYCYEGINVVLPIYESHGRKENFHRLFLAVLLSITGLFICFGLLWYGTFGQEVAAVATLNLPAGSAGLNVISPLYAVAALLTTPVIFFPIAQVLEPQLLPQSAWQNVRARRWTKNALRAALMLLSSWVAAVGGQQFMNFLAIIGGFCCGPLAFVFPAALHLRICEARGAARLLDCLALGAGLGITVLSTATAVASWGARP